MTLALSSYNKNVAMEEFIKLLSSTLITYSNFKQFSVACNNKTKIKMLLKKYNLLELEIDSSLEILFHESIEDEYAIQVINRIFHSYDELTDLGKELEHV